LKAGPRKKSGFGGIFLPGRRESGVGDGLLEKRGPSIKENKILLNN